LMLARLARPATPLFANTPALKPLAAMLALAPARLSQSARLADAAVPTPKGRVVMLQGCAEPVLRPEYRAATLRLLNRAGYDVAFAPGEGCCGALVHHMGREADSLDAARRNVDAWTRMIDNGGLDAIIVTASGCGTAIKDYGFMLRGDPAYAARAEAVSALARDVSEFLAGCDLPAGNGRGLTVAYHAACSLQHGQKVTDAPRRLLANAGFAVKSPAEAHLCCGSAGTYNILQPDIAGQLRDRKVANIARLNADVIATGNIGCAVQIGQAAAIPVVHTVELLDWATGGPVPAALAHISN
jgi:glycolate oxidase iron-sulfur subunit